MDDGQLDLLRHRRRDRRRDLIGRLALRDRAAALLDRANFTRLVLGCIEVSCIAEREAEDGLKARVPASDEANGTRSSFTRNCVN